MPSRVACLAILLYWSVAAVGLVRRDLLPELSVGAPPDLLAIAGAGGGLAPSRWSVQVVDDPSKPDERRDVGQAVTMSRRRPDGWMELTSNVTFNSGKLLKSMPLGYRTEDKIEFKSLFEIEPAGNLRSFRASVKSASDPADVVRIEGTLRDHKMEVVSKGPLPLLNRKFSFEYQDRGVVGSKFGPIDRLPGLRVGQRWEERIANPLTGQVETVRVAVMRKALIHWNGNPQDTHEVVHQSSSLSARTWVRRDGVVLRQEVPFPLLRLVLEREPDEPAEAAPP